MTDTSNTTPEEATDDSGHWLPAKLYDVLKFLAQLLLPGVATLYFALASIWHLPNAGEVVGTITAVDAFLGGFLAVSKAQWAASNAPYDGVVNVTTSPNSGTKKFSLEVNSDLDSLDKKTTLTFKVNPS